MYLQLFFAMLTYFKIFALVTFGLGFVDASDKGVDDPEALTLLHTLYSMTVNPVGRRAVVNALCQEENMAVLLPFTVLPGDEKTL